MMASHIAEEVYTESFRENLILLRFDKSTT